MSTMAFNPHDTNNSENKDITTTGAGGGDGGKHNASDTAPQAQPKNENENENGKQEEKQDVNVLKVRKDDKVSPQDHRKCEEAFIAANIDNLDDTQASDIYKYEHNLIKMATLNKEDTVINIATKKCGLDETDADLLATELIDRFGKSQSNGM